MRAPPRFTRSSHLVELVAEAERLAERIAAADADARGRLTPVRRRESAVATLRLDGSPIDAPTAERLAGRGPGGAPAGDQPRDPAVGGWHRTLRLAPERLHVAGDDDILAVELAGAEAGLEADDLAGLLLEAPVEALARLHRRMTAGLLAPELAGRPRTTEQAVHDASVGRIIYYAPSPADVVADLHVLGAWVTGEAAREHAVVLSGVLHFELLRLHPYEAANGRHARAAARLALRARGLDPDGLAAPEPWLARDPLATYEEVARTVRRRDLTIWLEHWGEAVTGGLRESGRRLGVLEAEPPPRALDFLRGRAGTFTVADYRAEAGAGPEETAADLRVLLDAGAVRRVPGGRGLRFEVAPRTGP